MRILVTGATGFVGRHITERLVADGHEVTITSGGTGPHHPGVKKILYRGLDGIDRSFFKNQDAVIHQLANNDTRCQDRTEMTAANYYGPMNLFHIAYEGGCRNFVYASSTAVYGAEPAPYVEDVTPVKPLNPYGLSKAIFDEFAMSFAAQHKVKVIGLRYCNVYGPGEDHKGKRMSMIGQLIRTMRTWERPKLFKDGEQKRDWIYVKDVVQMNMLALNKTTEEPFGRIYNCGSGVATSFNEVVRTINELMFDDEHMWSVPEYIDCPFADEYQSFTQCSIEKAGRELLFRPSYDLRSGVSEYIKELTYA